MSADRTPAQELGTRVRARREQLGFSQRELAELLDIYDPYVSSIENGRTRVGLTLLIGLARALQIKLSVLVDGLEE